MFNYFITLHFYFTNKITIFDLKSKHVISKLIAKYLKTHRRVNIPGVGAFVVKGDEGHEIIFSELLKSDDGVLNILLRQQGLSEIESAAMLDRFVFELRHSTEEGEFEIEGVGTLHREAGGRLAFVASPRVEQVEEVKVEQAESETEEQTAEEEIVAEERAEESSIEEEVTPEVQGEEPKHDGGASRYTAERIKELYSHPQTFRESEKVVRDLKYSQQRQKPLGGYTYVREKTPKRGVDKVLLFGVLAAVVALGVIAYGYYVANIEEVTDLLIELGLKSVE